MMNSTSSVNETVQAQYDMLTLTCETNSLVLGLQEGEVECTPIRLACILVSVSVASAWFSRRKAIGGKLLLFFSHWLSGLLYMLALWIQSTMIMVCLTDVDLHGFVKAIKFIELIASNMYAMTNLAISVNLTQIVVAHRTLSTVRSGSSFVVVLLSLLVSVGAAAASAPFWTTMFVTGTAFWNLNGKEGAAKWIILSLFYVEFIVGACMFIMIAWLLLFWMEEVKQCWKVHARIRYYFGLTVIGSVNNLAIGICGTLFVIGHSLEVGLLMMTLTWALRYIHIALDTIVLYGVLATKSVDESAASSETTSDARTSADNRFVTRGFDLNRMSSGNPRVSEQSS